MHNEFLSSARPKTPAYAHAASSDVNNVAVLIDADNTNAETTELLLREAKKRGRVVVKRAYGNWSKPELRAWEEVLKKNGVKAMQQFDFVAGKNATDIALTIDAMDLLSQGIYRTFFLASSDSDFTPLAMRLRECGAEVYGFGRKHAPMAFRTACDEFLLFEELAQPEGEQKDIHALTPVSASSNDGRLNPSEDPELETALQMACRERHEPDGWTDLSKASDTLRFLIPGFSCKKYGCSQFVRLIESLSDRYEIGRNLPGRCPDRVFFRPRG